MPLSRLVPPSFVLSPRGRRSRRALGWAGPLAAAAWVSAGAPLAPRAAGAQLAGASSVYAELLGNGGAYSVNYDRRLGAGAASVRVGLASWETTGGLFVSASDERRSFVTVPVLLNALTGTGTHHLELGGGVLLGSQRITRGGGAPERSAIVNATGTLGYRRQRPGRGWVFRAGLTPFYGFGTEEEAYPERGFFLSGGLSVGYSF
jgi:hypothetical protein